MRSRLEARVAAWLDRNRFAWMYEPTAFKTDRGGEYLPDFSFGPIPQGLGWGGRFGVNELVPAFLEVKPGGVSIIFWQHRMEAIWEQLPHAVLVIAMPPEDLVVAPTDAAVRIGLGPGWESDDPTLFGPTWDGGWFGRCLRCDRVGLYFSPGWWRCQWCGHYDGNNTWADLVDWPYLSDAWRRESEGLDA